MYVQRTSGGLASGSSSEASGSRPRPDEWRGQRLSEQAVDSGFPAGYGPTDRCPSSLRAPVASGRGGAGSPGTRAQSTWSSVLARPKWVNRCATSRATPAVPATAILVVGATDESRSLPSWGAGRRSGELEREVQRRIPCDAWRHGQGLRLRITRGITHRTSAARRSAVLSSSERVLASRLAFALSTRRSSSGSETAVVLSVPRTPPPASGRPRPTGRRRLRFRRPSRGGGTQPRAWRRGKDWPLSTAATCTRIPTVSVPAGDLIHELSVPRIPVVGSIKLDRETLAEPRGRKKRAGPIPVHPRRRELRHVSFDVGMG